MYIYIASKPIAMSERIRTLASLTYMRAQLLCAMLEEDGIECFITNINRIKEAPGGVKVKINEADARKAMDIYKSFKSAYGKQKEPAISYMKTIRRILVPVDFTTHSENAIHYALLVASHLKADIKLFNAYLDPIGTPQTYFESYAYHPDFDKIIKEIEEETERSLKALAARAQAKIAEKKIVGVNVSYDMAKGNAVNVVLSETEDFKPGIIIIGTRGSELDGIRSFGSFTAQIIDKSSVPVLAIPSGFDAQAVVTPKKILYASDFDHTDFNALSRLITIAHPFNSRVYCIHVSQNEVKKEDELLMLELRKYLFDVLGEENIECGLLESDDMQQGIEKFIKSRNIDVLALTTHKRNFIQRLFKPSITKKFLFQSNIPLLVFQARLQS